jgi:c-di-GMP-binding flagellar brake protein YcgR
MRPRRVVAPDEATQIFDQAVRERALVVITVQEDDDWRTFKCRFLERDPNGRFFVLDYQTDNGQAPPPIVPGQYVGVSFRYKSRKVMFSTVIEAKGRYVLDDKTSIPAMRYRWPETMTELQRRAYFRTEVPAGTTVPVKYWEGGLNNRGRDDAPAGDGQLADMSCGGCLVRLPGDAPVWDNDATVGLEISLPDGKPPILVNANYRGTRVDEEGRLGVAVQFVGLELSVDGRVVLQRISGVVQRFHRLTSGGRPPERNNSFGF